MPTTSLLLLGRPLLVCNGRPQALTIRKGWALLVLLACAGNAGVPRGRAAALLWPALDESVARRNLRRELARLAEVDADADAGESAGRIVAADGDYLALVATTELDLRSFEAACAQGRHDDALALWRGPLAEGLDLPDAPAFDEWLAGERERLRAQWRRLHEAAAAAAPNERAITHLRTLLGDDPLQERHHRALIALLFAVGQREAALAQYERCRRLLVDELGLAPMAETAALVATLRREPVDPEDPHEREPAQLSSPLRLPGELPFVGRHAEVRALEAGWSRGGWMLIQGEGGVGKTRLVADFCAAHGAYALARCRPGDSAVPYAAFTRALRVLAGDALAAAGLPAWVSGELARVLPELGSVPAPLASGEDEARFVEACAQAWQRLGDGSFDAVVIDDWHLADEPSRNLVGFIAARLDAASPRLLLLARPDGDRPAPLATASLHLVLAPLPGDAVAELVRRLSGIGAPTRFAERLCRATGGNPYFIAETLRHLAETGALRADARGRWSTPYDDATEDYRELPLPATVRDAVLARVRRLPDAPRRLLEAASLATEPFRPGLLAVACSLSELEATAALEQAADAVLIRAHDGGGFGFSHDLAQQALAAALTPERRRLVHRRLALAAEATRAPPALIALHFEAAGEPQRAVAWRLAAGDAAQALYAGDEALRQWQAALADRPTPEQTAMLLPRCARTLIEQGDAPGALARIGELDVLLARAVLPDADRADALIACADLACAINRDDVALARIDALLAGLPDGPRRAEALRVRGSALQKLGRLDEAQASAEAALALNAGDGLARAELLELLMVVEHQRGRAQNVLVIARQAAALWAAHGDRRAVARGHYRVGVALVMAGDPKAGEIELEQACRMAAEMHLVEQQREALINLMKIHSDRGDGARVLAMAEEAWNLSPSFPRPRLRQLLVQARLHGNLLIGQLGQALVIAEQVLAEATASGEPAMRQYAVLSMLDLLVYLGDFDRGRALLAALPTAGAAAFFNVKLALNRAFLESHAGDVAAARAAMAEAGDPLALQAPQDRAAWSLREAEVLLAEGHAHAALALLEPWRRKVPNSELAALIWAARLRAQAALHNIVADDWAAALAALDAGDLPALEALTLRRVLARTAPDAARTAALARSVHEASAALAASLAAWPRQRAFLLARSDGCADACAGSCAGS